MTVVELLKVLQKVDGNTPVYFTYDSRACMLPIKQVDLFTDDGVKYVAFRSEFADEHEEQDREEIECGCSTVALWPKEGLADG